MAEQVRRGYDVSYFFSGRQYPLARGPRLSRWSRDGVRMLEVVNSPLFDHGRQPLLELEEPRVEALLEAALADLRPDAVHVQELAGLPSSVLDVIGRSGPAPVLTLQDYFPVCSTFKLLDAQGRVCTRQEIGADCVAATRADPRPSGLLIEATINHRIRAMSSFRRLRHTRLNPALQGVSRGVATRVATLEAARRTRRTAPEALPADFQRRRELNIERLNQAGCVIAMSHRVAEIYQRLGVAPERLRTIQLTLGHIEQLVPREMEAGAAARPLTFATLAGFESEAKGAHLLLETLRLLEDRARAGSFRLLVLGYVDPRFQREASRMPGVEIEGSFSPGELNSVLEQVDVGLMPSVWEEAYGYAGVEFLAKGIPVIANAIGGMPDYTREGETGWLNQSCSAQELAQIMSGILDEPGQVPALNALLRTDRDSVVIPMSRHADTMDEVYRQVAGAA